MKLLAIVLALLLDHLRPAWRPAWLSDGLAGASDWLLKNFNGGQARHGGLAWLAGALAPALLVGLIGALLGWLAWPLAWLWSVAILFLTLSLRELVLAADEIAAALAGPDPEPARARLAAWRSGDSSLFSAEEIVRAGVEEVLRRGLTALFAPLFWFIVLGPFGVAGYWLSRYLAMRWQGEYGFIAPLARILDVLDWLPARLLAFSFAIVGNYEGAMRAWRHQAGLWQEGNEGVVLAAGAGALGIRLGGELNLASGLLTRPVLGEGEAAGGEYLPGAVNLLRRALLLWLAVLLLLLLGGIGSF